MHARLCRRTCYLLLCYVPYRKTVTRCSGFPWENTLYYCTHGCTLLSTCPSTQLLSAAVSLLVTSNHEDQEEERMRPTPAVQVSDSLSTRLTPAAVGRTLRSCHHYTRVSVHQLQIESACCPQPSPRSLRAVSAVVDKRNRTRAVAVALAVDRLLTDESYGFRQA